MARRLADALRGVGCEVWFDEHELRGGRFLGCQDPAADSRMRAVPAGHFAADGRPGGGLFPSRVETGGGSHARHGGRYPVPAAHRDR
ncbi:MAG: hypothetical protein ACKVI3_20835 [Verrucomicrobiia bacterium]